MDYQSLAKLVSNKYGLRFVALSCHDDGGTTQGLILANYTDECTELVPLKRYFPNYHDLSMAQLRTYFTWRAKLRWGSSSRSAIPMLTCTSMSCLTVSEWILR